MFALIEPARTEDVEPVLALLRDNHLPADGLSEHIATTLVARQDGRVVGSAALEVYEHGALLRSLAVAPRLQHCGLGQALTAAAIQLAESRRVAAVYLLTTTAENYFPKFGVEAIQRTDVPASVRASVEFTSACPSSAVVMRKLLSGSF